MSLFLSMLGLTALLGATVVTPVVAATPKIEESKINFRLHGTYQIAQKVEAEVTAGPGSNHLAVQKSTEEIINVSWFDILRGNWEDYFNIDWENSWFTLNITLYYKGNVWGDSGTTYKKQERYEGDQLRTMFIQPTKMYEDGRLESAWGREIEHTWEYVFSDTGKNLVLNTRVWVSAKDNYAWSYASIAFDTLDYSIALVL